MCRYNWHSDGSHISIKYTEAVLSNSTRKLLWYKITEILIAVFKNKFIVSFITIFGTLSLPTEEQLSQTHSISGHIVFIFTHVLVFI